MKYICLFFIVYSCALFRVDEPLENKQKEVLLNSVRLTGEGRGRLTLNQKQYVFNVDSILNENFDWVFAISIPLQGEEVLIFQDLRQNKIKKKDSESFEKRIRADFLRLNLNNLISIDHFLNELRSLIRFNLAESLGQKRFCASKERELICILDGEKFIINVNKKEFFINKSLKNGIILQLVARNLTKSFFHQTDIRLYVNQEDLLSKNSAFSLELFW
jgi:hypothetical protein